MLWTEGSKGTLGSKAGFWWGSASEISHFPGPGNGKGSYNFLSVLH